MRYIGIDLGTSSVKLLLMAEDGSILRTVSRSYPLSMPHSGWSEQNPEDWWQETCAGVRQLLEGEDPASVAGLSFGGQMHGLVALDRDDRVLRPAILWNDGRTAEETEWLNREVGEAQLAKWTGNIAFAGFTAPKLLWMRKHEPELFQKIDKIMLPKDYLAYRMTGVHCTDCSDAAGTLLMDVEYRYWSEPMLEKCGLRRSQMPQLFESWQVVGTLTAKAAKELGLPETVKVCAGAGDNAAAAIGTGALTDGACNLSVGTSGTVFVACDRFPKLENHAIHAFAHANGKFHLLGCMLSAASCNQWWVERILKETDYAATQKDIANLGENPVLFAPYLMGERTPHNDPALRGAFIGLSLDTTREQMTQAILEGVAFAMRDGVELAKAAGIPVPRCRICGGGAKSRLWKTIFANVLGVPVDSIETEEGPAMGAAMLAAVGCGAYSSVEQLAEKIVRVTDTVEPDAELTAKYEKRYQQFRKLYPALRTLE